MPADLRACAPQRSFKSRARHAGDLHRPAPPASFLQHAGVLALPAIVALALLAPVAASAATLPDHRAYELVSTGEKNEHDVTEAYVTEHGEHVVWGYGYNDAGTLSAREGRWISERTSDGWLSSNIAAPGADVLENPERANTPPTSNPLDVSDTGEALYMTSGPLSPRDTNGADDVYLRPADGSYTWLTEAAIAGGAISTAAGTEPRRQIFYAGRSADFSHVIFESNQQLLPGMPEHPTGNELYEWREGTLRVVGVLPDDSIPAGGAGAGSGASSGASDVQDAISSNGDHIFFESPDPFSRPSTPPQLYVRIEGERTVWASQAQAGVTDADGLQPAEFVGASRDGSAVFFLSRGTLTANANTGNDTTDNLYEYDVESGTLTDISPDSNPLDAASGAQVDGLAGIDEDGTEVYFVALGALTPQATDGQPNIYVYHTVTRTTGYVATVGFQDHEDWIGVFGANRGGLNAEVTPDGQHLVFLSTASLTGYANAGYAEAYEYTTPSETLKCVSCGAAGTVPTASAGFGEGHAPLQNAPRNVSDAGSRVFFDTATPLVSQASNGLVNVYEWENGNVYLISPGTSTEKSEFVGMSRDGGDAYFLTRDQLVPSDQDHNVNVYDARENGGFPEAAASTRSCSESECQSSSAPPASPVPGSALFSGGTNLQPPAPALAAKPTPKPLTRAQELSKALKACKKLKKRAKQGTCETSARKKYGPPHKAKARKSTSSKGGPSNHAAT